MAQFFGEFTVARGGSQLTFMGGPDNCKFAGMSIITTRGLVLNPPNWDGYVNGSYTGPKSFNEVGPGTVSIVESLAGGLLNVIHAAEDLSTGEIGSIRVLETIEASPVIPDDPDDRSILDFGNLGGVGVLHVSHNCRDEDPDPNPTPEPVVFPRDPLIIDMDGDGVELIALGDSQAMFDHNQDGFAERTAWVSADDALVVWDQNGDGKINHGGELFGDQEGHADGFAHLATLDSNGDGRITAEDTDFARLQIWHDADGDAHTDGGELLTLTEAGISEINLNAQSIRETNAGNEVGLRSTVTFDDGAQHVIDDVWLSTNQRHTRTLLDDDFHMNIEAMLLPELVGSGQIANMWIRQGAIEFSRRRQGDRIPRRFRGFRVPVGRCRGCPYLGLFCREWRGRRWIRHAAPRLHREGRRGSGRLAGSVYQPTDRKQHRPKLRRAGR